MRSKPMAVPKKLLNTTAQDFLLAMFREQNFPAFPLSVGEEQVYDDAYQEALSEAKKVDKMKHAYYKMFLGNGQGELASIADGGTLFFSTGRESCTTFPSELGGFVDGSQLDLECEKVICGVKYHSELSIPLSTVTFTPPTKTADNFEYFQQHGRFRKDNLRKLGETHQQNLLALYEEHTKEGTAAEHLCAFVGEKYLFFLTLTRLCHFGATHLSLLNFGVNFERRGDKVQVEDAITAAVRVASDCGIHFPRPKLHVHADTSLILRKKVGLFCL